MNHGNNLRPIRNLLGTINPRATKRAHKCDSRASLSYDAAFLPCHMQFHSIHLFFFKITMRGSDFEGFLIVNYFCYLFILGRNSISPYCFLEKNFNADHKEGKSWTCYLRFKLDKYVLLLLKM